MKTKRSIVWFRIAAIFQIATGLIHSLSFFVSPQPANETEKQLIDLMTSYQLDMGAGFHRNFDQIFTSVSICMTLLCLFAGTINIYLIKTCSDLKVIKGAIVINAIVFLFMLIDFIVFAFLPPIICAGLICVALLLSLLFNKPQLD